MSWLSSRDDDMHYCDGSHRWTPPIGVNPRAWREQVAAHVAAHGGSRHGWVPPRQPRPLAVEVPR